MEAKLAARRAALERGFAAQTRAAVSALDAERGRAGDRAQAERRSLHANAAHAATVEAMLAPQTPVMRCPGVLRGRGACESRLMCAALRGESSNVAVCGSVSVIGARCE